MVTGRTAIPSAQAARCPRPAANSPQGRTGLPSAVRNGGTFTPQLNSENRNGGTVSPFQASLILPVLRAEENSAAIRSSPRMGGLSSGFSPQAFPLGARGSVTRLGTHSPAPGCAAEKVLERDGFASSRSHGTHLTPHSQDGAFHLLTQ